jgi:hypothetical protein
MNWNRRGAANRNPRDAFRDNRAAAKHLIMAGNHAFRHAGLKNGNKKRHLPEGSGVFVFTTSKEEFCLSLAGLAVTYSPRA